MHIGLGISQRLPSLLSINKLNLNLMVTLSAVFFLYINFQKIKTSLRTLTLAFSVTAKALSEVLSDLDRETPNAARRQAWVG